MYISNFLIIHFVIYLQIDILQHTYTAMPWHQMVFFSGEGPRSRRYGRTAAMRLLVQPYDEDEDDYYFLSFS
jgi:hypothetical protein